MKLILVRHGQTRWNIEKRVQGISDIELCNRGLAQAGNLALALSREKIEAICSSPLKRALQTARTINGFHRLPIEEDQNLIELNQGDFEGLTFPEIIKNHGGFLTQWMADPASVVMPNGESLEQLQKRTWTSVERILAHGKNTVIVSHSFAISTILCKIQGIDLRFIRQLHVDLASRTAIQFTGGKSRILFMNDIEYLKGCEKIED
ncbi:MAG: histidine phosphatase family protein [Syntrophales bacterium]|nr:histidine phosphatase family protein [Syntrophales bacterium]MDY0043588.1 histidine phosphatase family protein [Syntrophales bacterium]